jgi:hypothetical protein
VQRFSISNIDRKASLIHSLVLNFYANSNRKIFTPQSIETKQRKSFTWVISLSCLQRFVDKTMKQVLVNGQTQMIKIKHLEIKDRTICTLSSVKSGMNNSCLLGTETHQMQECVYPEL